MFCRPRAFVRPSSCVPNARLQGKVRLIPSTSNWHRTSRGTADVIELSRVRGDRTRPLLDKTLGDFFQGQVSTYGDKEVLSVLHQGIKWSWRDLNNKVGEFALGLIKLELTKGDRLGIWMTNSSEWMVVQLSCALLGIISVNLNPAYVHHELEHAINLVGCKALVFNPEFNGRDHTALLQKMIPELNTVKHGEEIESARLPSLKHIITTADGFVPQGMTRFKDHLILQAGPGDYTKLHSIASRVAPDDAASIQFTSGTAGHPKGATLSHISILNNGVFVGNRIHLSPTDKVCLPLPLHHAFGMVVGQLSALAAGASIVLPGPYFDPTTTLQAISHERCTVLHGTSTMFNSTLRHPQLDSFHVGCLRAGVVVGGPCSLDTIKHMKEKLTITDVSICYGMTETSPISFQTAPGDPLEEKPNTVGKVLDHLEAKVVGMDGGTLPRHEPGELLIRGYSVMKGYWQDVVDSKAVIDEDGWFHTGDVAVFDDADYAFIVGRLKDTILKGGASIQPLEVEEFLSEFPGIQTASVVGVPDEEYGEHICAWVVMKEGKSATAEQIIDFCKKQMAHYKVPKYVLFVDHLPTTERGTIQKYKMREESIKRFGLNVEKEDVGARA